MLRIIAYLFTLFLITASGEIIIKPSSDSYNITPQVRYYLTSSDIKDYIEVLTKDQNFTKIGKDELLLGYIPDKTLWLRLDITNDSNKSVEKVLSYSYELQEMLYLYELGNNKTHQLLRQDSLVPYFKLRFQPHETKNFLIQARNQNVGTIVKLEIFKPLSFFRLNNHKMLMGMLFLGGIGTILLYNLFLFYLTKDSSYIYYIVIVMIFAIISLYITGFIGLFFPEFTLTKSLLYTILLMLAVAMVFFTKTFLDLPNSFPKIDRTLDAIFVLLVILYLGNMFDIIPMVVHRFVYTLSFGYLIFIGIFAYRHGKKEALYYILGWFVLFASTLLLVLRQAGISDLYDSIPYLSYIGVISEALLFSMALSARINTLQHEKERAAQILLQHQLMERSKLEAYAKEKTKDLQNALEEKAMLLKELHHRVKNNLQIIISLLRLQADKHNDPRLEAILLESENRMRAISSIHEMLYKEDNPVLVDVDEYFRTLIEGIRSGFAQKKNITISLACTARLDMDRAVYCGLIINELVTNAFKYAFDADQPGKIRVSFKKIADRYELVIFDNGKGFASPEELQEGLGLRMVQTLVRQQLKGRLYIDGKYGAYFEITFPVR